MTVSTPVIGLTCSHKDGDAGSFSIGASYLRSVERAGGAPVLLSATEGLACIPSILDRVDGVLLIGGPDIDPAVYGASKHEKTTLMSSRRQAFDLALAKEAMERDMPLMGICLGCQEVAVAAGATLIQHVPDTGTQILHSGKPCPRHDVRVDRESKLCQILGCETLSTNSSHHQAIDHPGDGMRAVAWARDGIVEAGESTRHRFVFAIQWHPEQLIDEPVHLRLFQALVDAARG